MWSRRGSTCTRCGTDSEDDVCYVCHPDHPARCPHCGYTPGVIPSDFDAYAQANCEHKEGHAKPSQYLNPACRESGCDGTPCGHDGSPDACGHYKRPAAPPPGGVTRYELCTSALGDPSYRSSSNGLFVLYPDHKRIVSAYARRLAEAEAELISTRSVMEEQYERRKRAYSRAEAAEACVRELEASIDAMAEAHAHDDMALTAAYLNGAHEGKNQAEAERDALRERCENQARILKHSQDVFDAIDMTGLCPLCQGDEDHNSGCPMRAVEEDIQAALAATEVPHA